MMARLFHARKRSVLDLAKKSQKRVKVEQGEVEVEGVAEGKCCRAFRATLCCYARHGYGRVKAFSYLYGGVCGHNV